MQKKEITPKKGDHILYMKLFVQQDNSPSYHWIFSDPLINFTTKLWYYYFLGEGAIDSKSNNLL
jgi:hypothetical protein